MRFRQQLFTFAISRRSRNMISATQMRCFTQEIPREISIKNEPILGYLKGSKERENLEKALNEMKSSTVEVPCVVGGREIRTKTIRHHTSPFNHSHKVATYCWADESTIGQAIEVALKARADWERVSAQKKIDLFLRAADLVAGKYRWQLNAATMIGQGKTVFQAEIDSACELADFLRFNALFWSDILRYKPISSDPSVTVNSYRQRGLEGFVTAISPFNFSAIGGNLASAPTIAGNVVLWKPSDAAVLSNYLIYKAFMEAGFPPEVIQFLPAEGATFGRVTSASPHLAAVNFTGSVPTFKTIWKDVAKNLDNYRNYPRLVGECGGKNFHFVHSSADVESVVAHTIRSAFEFSGQKCSACERLYVPKSLWPKVKDGLLAVHKTLKMGSPLEFDTFLSAVIDKAAFTKIKGFIDYAKNNPKITVLAGGNCDDSKGWFIEPTILMTSDPLDRIMKEEIFGPVVTVFVYDDADLEKTMALALDSVVFGLTASIFGQDRAWLDKAVEQFKMAGGNFYVNDKSTGAIVGQQPFGGARLSGTNDKAGGPHYLLRFASPQTIKETNVPLTDIVYPYMK